MKKEKLLVYVLIFMMLIIVFRGVYAQEEFHVKDYKGEWDITEKDHIKSKSSNGYNYIELEEDGVVLGSWLTTIDLDLSGEQGDTITGKYIISIPELNFTLKYIEEYRPGWYLDIGAERVNNLIVSINDSKLYSLTDNAKWPFDTRLNTRLYFGIWRIDKDHLEIKLTDYYGKINENKSIYWNYKIKYNGETLTLLIRIEKDSSKKSVLEAYLYYNNLERDKIIGQEIEIRLLSIDSAALFYLSLGFLIIAIVANFTSRSWKYYEEKALPSKDTKKGKPSSRGR